MSVPSSAATRPEEVAPTEDGERLRIRWKDGHVSEYTPRFLRLACQCAACVDEMTGEVRLDPETVDPGVYPRSIEYVGRYALQFDWSDGHRTGIYPFTLLRGLCPCPECDARAEAQG